MDRRPMDCPTIEARFSAALDGDLDAAARADFEAHLAGCTACAASFAELQGAIAALRATPARGTAPELRAAILAAVDHDKRSRPRTAAARVAGGAVPIALAALGGAAAAAGIAWLCWPGPLPPTTVPTPLRLAVGDVRVELAAGASQVLGGAVFERDADGSLRVRLPAPAPSAPPAPTAWRWPEVIPLPLPVPIPVGVPIDRPVPEVVERIVDTGPLLTIEASGFGRSLERAGSQLGSGLAAFAQALRASPAARPPIATASAPAPRPDLPRIGGASVRVRRDGDRVTLETSGPIAELVPALLARLDRADPDLALVFERRLAAIHANAVEDAGRGSRLAAPRIDAARTPQERHAAWRAWWDANRDQLTGSPAESL